MFLLFLARACSVLGVWRARSSTVCGSATLEGTVWISVKSRPVSKVQFSHSLQIELQTKKTESMLNHLCFPYATFWGFCFHNPTSNNKALVLLWQENGADSLKRRRTVRVMRYARAPLRGQHMWKSWIRTNCSCASFWETFGDSLGPSSGPMEKLVRPDAGKAFPGQALPWPQWKQCDRKRATGNT